MLTINFKLLLVVVLINRVRRLLIRMRALLIVLVLVTKWYRL